MSDSELATYGLVRLPKDADGKMWHIGDEFECKGMRFTVDGFDCLNARTKDTSGITFARASAIHHYNPTPAERLRGIAKALDSGFTAQEYTDKIRDIADELEEDE